MSGVLTFQQTVSNPKLYKLTKITVGYKKGSSTMYVDHKNVEKLAEEYEKELNEIFKIGEETITIE